MKPRKLLVPCLAVALLGACSRPPPAPTEQRPEPQATALRDAVNAPLDKAKGVQATADAAAAQQEADIDAATQ
ncbi:hypothetical protein P6166_07070 [Stenotrophomonas sp. HITSZ_GD]|uniref:hypothetical protein n=1 Tax=Stenotrophomonas sp. HITSZ_GD TaxID=3037248 RepID=UPI00240D77D2|nr:hypothetical protein [Stenotrophomonas sp. HITSZ_GD]MDG2525114.1 hypothetical protein [Stenotrophomonas sp. HITSZ_GD]